MSVLLDALKKAAEEKKALSQTKIQSEEVDVASHDANTSTDHELSLVIEDTKVDANDLISLDSKIPASEGAFSLDSNATMPSSSFNEKSAPLELKMIEEPAHTPVLSTDLSDLLDEFEPSGIEIPEVKTQFTKQIESALEVKGTPVSGAGALEDETLGSKITSSKGDAEPLVTPVLDKASEFENPVDPILDSTPTSDQPPESVITTGQNPILVDDAFSSHRLYQIQPTSYKVLLGLLVGLFFIAISLYGLLYYQEQNEQLEQSMRKYALAKVSLNTPKVTAAPKENENETVNLTERVPQKTSLPIVTPEKVAENVKTTPQVDNVVAAADSRVDHSGGITQPRLKKTPVVKRKKTDDTPRRLVVEDKESIYLSNAYQAYNEGRLVQAAVAFKQALTVNDRSVTAYLGLGAIAVVQGNSMLAMDYYQRALNIQPENLSVYEAIANLSASVSLNSDWKKSLKNMVDIYPGSAPLQYGLGNLYAEENDWLSAQDAYFKAYSLDSTNPDFMVNLAISLDHLGKYALAAQYYTQAIALSEFEGINFDVPQIKTRLISIRQFLLQGR